MSTTFRHLQVPVSGGSIHAVASGPSDASPIVFLHGWPQDSSAWAEVMHAAGDEHHCIALDLPGIGGSSLSVPRGDKAYLAGLIHELIVALDLRDVTLVGHDAGGMIVYSYLRLFDDLRAAAILDTVIPGVPPWESVLANPYIWHFAFHSIPDLPEALVHGRQRPYFDYFYDAISANPSAITDEARERYAASYSEQSALTQGFELYRSLRADAEQNARSTGTISTPVLYLRGDREGGNIHDYADGFRGVGLDTLTTRIVEGSGHFAPEESPAEVWAAISSQLLRTTD